MANAMADDQQAVTTTMLIKQAHDRLGHNNEDTMRSAAKHLGTRITPRGLMPCEGCTIATAKQKNVPKVNETQVCATNFDERTGVFQHLKHKFVQQKLVNRCILTSQQSWLQQNEELPAVSKPNWHMLVDEATRQCIL